jgi:hypothetical protein
MNDKINFEEIADTIAKDVLQNDKGKRIKVRTLLKYFKYEKRTEENSAIITDLLAERNIILNPSIMKFGNEWKLKLDDRVYLIERSKDERDLIKVNSKIENKISIKDSWFDDVLEKVFRTEKEVENKFIIPLLSRLGFSDDDRYDGMRINTCHGSKKTVLEIDFALFNSENEILTGQTLLVAEAKKEERLYKAIELENAQKQVKSYAIWLSCHFGLVTDSHTIQVIDLFPNINGMKVIFETNRKHLKRDFDKLYSICSKESLTTYYENLNKM